MSEMVARPHLWKLSTRKAHGAPCRKCSRPTYCKDGICKECSKTPHGFPPVEVLPEDYLMRCAEELLKRHRVRAETLAKLGITTEAA